MTTDPVIGPAELSDTDEELMARLRIDLPARKTAPQTAKPHFTIVPDFWLERLFGPGVSCAALRVGLKLLRRTYRLRPAPLAVTNTLLAEARVDRHGKSRVLEELQGLGLIRVDWGLRGAPRATLLHLGLPGKTR